VTVREIRLYGDPVLKSATEPVVEIDEGVRQLVADLLETTRLEGRAGVAATQIGVGLSVFSYNVDGVVGYVINPELVETSGELREIGEGCLSVPGLWFDTPRYERAVVEGIDLDGNPVRLEGEGLMAQMLQHETDHLKGVVYLDRLSKETRREAMRAVRQSNWF